MKPTNLILAAFSFFIFTATLSAQNNTENVTLNVRLHPIQSLSIHPSQKIVDLNYVNKNDYLNGVSSEQQDHISIFSTGGFEISVKNDNSTINQSGKSIEASTLKIKAENGSQPIAGTPEFQERPLSPNEQFIVRSNVGAVDKTFNVKYTGAADNTYIDNYVVGQTPTVYTTTVTYTIVAQ